MKQFMAMSLLLAVAAGAPSPNYGGGSPMTPSYAQPASYSSPPQTTSYSGPNQQYNSQPVEFRTPQVSFTPPQIAYSQPGVTYSQPQNIAVPQQPTSYAAPPGYVPSPYSATPMVMGYKAAPAPSSYSSPSSYSPYSSY